MATCETTIQQVLFISKNTELKNDYRFKDQIKASSGSVMDNIAEGFERDGKPRI